MSEIPAWLETELRRANGTGNDAGESRSRQGRRLTDAQKHTVRRLIRERLRENPKASGQALRREVARTHGVTISESWWFGHFWNPIRNGLRIAPPPQRVPSAVADSRIRGFIRDRLVDDPTLSGRAVLRMAWDELGINIPGCSWYRRYWGPTLNRLGLKVREPGFGPAGASRYTPEVQLALRDFVRVRMADGPAVSARKLWREAVESVGVEVSETYFRRRFWRPIRDGKPVRIVGVPGGRVEPRETALEGSESESVSMRPDLPERSDSNAHSGTTIPSSAPNAPPTDGNGAALPEWRRTFEHFGTAGRVVVRERRNDRRWRIEIDAWVDEETARAVFEKVGAAID